MELFHFPLYGTPRRRSTGVLTTNWRSCSKVLLRRGASGILVAVFKEKDTLEEMPDEL